MAENQKPETEKETKIINPKAGAYAKELCVLLRDIRYLEKSKKEFNEKINKEIVEKTKKIYDISQVILDGVEQGDLFEEK